MIVGGGPAEAQDAVLVRFVHFRRLGRGEAGCLIASGVIEVPDHALGRVMQRAPRADLGRAVLETGRWYLALDAGEVDAIRVAGSTLYLPGADGLFLCHAHLGARSGAVFARADVDRRADGAAGAASA